MTTVEDLISADETLAHARAGWHAMLYENAAWPDENDPIYASANGAKPKRVFHIDEPTQHSVLQSDLCFQVSRFLFFLNNLGFSDPDRVEALMRGQNSELNARIADLEADSKRSRITGFTRGRLKAGIFKEEQIQFSRMLVEAHKKPILYASVLGCFMTRIGSRSSINECTKVLDQAELIKTMRGPSNAVLIMDASKLVGLYEEYLKSLISGLEKVLSK